MQTRNQFGMLLASWTIVVACPAHAAQYGTGEVRPGHEPATTDPGSVAAREILATLGKQPITRGELDFVLGRVRRPKLPPLSFAAEQTAIHLVARQQQALQTLRKQRLAASRQQVESWIQNSSQGSRESSATEIAEQIATENSIDDDFYWELMSFRLSWQSYLAKHLTEANLARHFANQSARFNGTRFQVQVLSAAVPAGKSARRDKAAKDLESLRIELSAGRVEPNELSKFADEHVWELSEAKWIEGTGSLDPLAIDALLPMQVGDVSQPVHTPSGVHLIRLLDKQVGDLQLGQVKDEVRAHLLIYFLNYLASLSEDQLPLVAKE